MTSEVIALWTETSSDPELIAGVRAGDSAAFGVLYERHADAARKVASQYTNSASDVDDVVSEAFSRVLRALQRGDGPDLAFRAYLFTIVRRTGMDIIDKGIRTKPRDDMSPYESAIGYGASSDEPALDGFEHGMVADAFKSLPERWQAVLWYTEVEKKSPREIAPLLGLSANGVAALAYRAREALRQAYLQQHLNTSESADCLEANTQLGAYVRGGLSKREHSRIDAHVRGCERCGALVAELEDVNRGMRGIIAPLFMGVLGAGALDGGLPIGGALGPQAAGATSAAGAGGAGGAGATGATAVGVGGAAGAGGLAGLLGVLGHVALPAAAVVAATALALNGASILGWITPGGDLADGDSPLLSAPTASTSPSADATSTPSAAPSAGASAEPSPEPSPGLAPEGAGGDADGQSDAPSGGVTPRFDVVPTGASNPGGSGEDAEPGTGPTGPGTDPSDPGTDPSDPGAGPTSPGAGPTDPGTEATDPGTEATDPGTGPTDPGDGPSDPDGGDGPGDGPGDEPGDTPVAPANLRLDAGALDFLEISRTTPQLTMTVTNSGEGPATDLQASIQLPDGLAFAGPGGGNLGTAGNGAGQLAAYLEHAQSSTMTAGAWDCEMRDAGRAADCTREALPAQSTATLTLALTLPDGPLAPGSRTRFSVSGGSHAYQYELETAIAELDDDLDPIYTGSGGLAVATVGSPLLGCDLTQGSCRAAMFESQSRNNNDVSMVPMLRAGGERNSATTILDLPEDAEVVYASLEWSANRGSRDEWTSIDLSEARLRAPGTDGYTTLQADEVYAGDTALADGRHYYQSRADVTELVAAHGAGAWSVADIATAATRLDSDPTYYAGFALSVVYRHADLPDSRIALFAGREWVSPDRSPEFVFSTAEDADVAVDWITWEADRALSGDTLELDGVRLVPVRWDGPRLEPMHASANQRASWAGNGADSSAHGSEFSNSLGVDAKPFERVSDLAPGIHRLTARSTGDQYLVGSIAVTIAYDGAESDEDWDDDIVVD